MTNRSWLADFTYEDGAVLVKKTGHRVPLSRVLFQDVFSWLSFFVLAQSWRTWRRLTGHKRATIAFHPDRPRPWYLIWPVMHAAGARVIDDAACADTVFHFEDRTRTTNTMPVMKPDARAVNFRCDDVTKSRVAEAFARVAGYELAVDPQAWSGPMLEKSEENATHDGRIIEGPRAPQPGKVYQRVVDNEVPGGLVEDLRCPIVGGDLSVVFRKRRALARRFENENMWVVLDQPGQVFSADEIDVIRRFAQEIGLDWGGLDVLRDRASGKIYVVDANKTDMGPPVALKLGDKLKATRRMARVFAERLAPGRP